MFISVVVPVYNASPYLNRCLDALVSQDYARGGYEIIVVDNNSTDGSAALAEQYNRVRLLYESRQGPYAARNRGVRAAGGEVIAFTDPDCIPAQGWLSQIARSMSNPAVGVVLGSRRPARSSFALSMISAYENTKDGYALSGRVGEVYYGYTNNMAVRRKMFERAGLFVEIPRGADTIMVRRLVDLFSPDVIVHSPDMIVTHLELDSIRSYYRKTFLYGRQREINNSRFAAGTRPLSRRERMEVFMKAVREHRYSIARSAIFLFLLLGGLTAWNAGALVARLGGAGNGKTTRTDTHPSRSTER